jgi:murein L,D-transpeptidase YcbB/YkuD
VRPSRHHGYASQADHVWHCEAANVNAPDTSVADGPIEPGTDSETQKAQEKPARSVEDVALSERLQNLIANSLQQYVARSQDRIAVEAFYRGRDFAPLWANAGGPLPATQQVIDLLHGVAADGLDPKDYPTPTFADRSPERLAADELGLTNSVVTFVRHASMGRVAFSRVSGSIYFDLKSHDLQQMREKIASSHDVAATLDSFNPQQPQYKGLKAALTRARDTGKAVSQAKVLAARIDAILANMERWRWLPRELGAAYVMVNIPDYTSRPTCRNLTSEFCFVRMMLLKRPGCADTVGLLPWLYSLKGGASRENVSVGIPPTDDLHPDR